MNEMMTNPQWNEQDERIVGRRPPYGFGYGHGFGRRPFDMGIHSVSEHHF
ncbi:hypothetical protein GCM10010978_06110 [Compostibacillus humi]|uniref:Uncharacterized protein n=1 Tax=Compostibacillus humi TaxID=1245525 RepID=A0A8J3EK74_9BACI|nr:hypothetical protein GCM10010978_06110 [Compostibacillus humi]